MKKLIFILSISVFIISCKKDVVDETPPDTTVPVTITSIDTSGVESFVDLNATASYLVKNIIKANSTGYLNSVNVQSNDYVSQGKVLFSLKTRESKVLGNTINKIDKSLNFGGAINVRAETSGFITNVNVQSGDYVQDGDQLATINDASSFAIVLSLPFELKKYVGLNKQYQVFLPDGNSINATAIKFMASVDMASQTQNVILKCSKNDIPENLVVKVRITIISNPKSISLPKSAVLSNETETDFWIMKMINKDTAIKVLVKKGVETDSKIEILSPVLTLKDKILVTGNYGVADTIKVKIIK